MQYTGNKRPNGPWRSAWQQQQVTLVNLHRCYLIPSKCTGLPKMTLKTTRSARKNCKWWMIPKTTLNVTRSKVLCSTSTLWFPNSTLFCSMVTCFPDSWCFGFPIWYNGEFEFSPQKSLKVRKSNFRKSPMHCFVRIIRRKVHDNFEEFKNFICYYLLFVGGVVFWNVHCHQLPW